MRVELNLLWKHITSVVLLVISNTKQQDSVCPISTNEHVQWPETKSSSCVRSQPLCINEKMEIASRCCNSQGCWETPPSCHYVQLNIENPCPDHATQWSKNICILVIKETTYPPQCPYEETLAFYDYIEAVDSNFLPVWMPILRNTGKYGIGLLHWMEPTVDYGSSFMSCGDHTCRNYRFSGSITDKNCVIFYNTSYIEAVSCDEQHTAICAYRSLPDRANTFCSQNFITCVQSDYSTRSKCFCKGDSTTTQISAEFLQPYQNLIYSSLSTDTCYIGLQKGSDDTYIWSNSSTTINYTNWAENALFGEDYIYGATSDDGWILTKTKNETTCELYEMDPPIKPNRISLEYDEDDKQFVLNLNNPTNWMYSQDQSGPMVFCFTDAVQDALISTIEVVGSVIGDHAVFNFQPHNNGPGTYWCEAFPYPDTTPMRSNEYLLRYTDSFTEEYVVLLKTNYVKGSNPLTKTNMKSIRENLASQLDTLQVNSSFYPRIYKIVNVDEQNSEMTINFHLTNPGQSTPLSQYSTLRGYMEQSLTNFTFVNVFGVDQCVGVQSGTFPQTITWPVTDIHDVAVKPREGYCIKSDGSIMFRTCNGNYIDGAQWSELEEPCTIQQSTNTTVNLTNIIDLNKSEEYIVYVADIVANHRLDLLPIDVHLISIFLEQVAEAEYEVDLNLTVQIISELMDIPISVLRSSQILFNATDRILYYTDKIIEKSKFIGDILEENLIIMSYYVKEANLSGAVINCVDELYYNISKLYNKFDLDEVMGDETVRAAIVISEDLLSQVLKASQNGNSDKSRIVITVFKNSNLFNEQGLDLVSTSFIIGAMFPDLKEEYSGNIFTIHNKSDGDDNFNCSYWKYDLGKQKGFWQSHEFTNYSKSSILCSYNHLTHLAVARKITTNVTEELENILASNGSLPEKLKSTSFLIKNHLTQFKSVDVMLLSRLFYEVSSSDEDNLELVADILDKVIEIPPNILRDSQILYNATGKLLKYFETLLHRIETSQVVSRYHFSIIIQLLDEEAVYGFTLNYCDVTCNLTLLYEEVSEDDISSVENLDTALLINEVLMEQILNFTKENYRPKLVITIFFTDALLIEDYNNIEIATKVVGVCMPGFDESLNDGINVMYSVKININSNYSCSVYSNDPDDSTAQKGFWNSENPPISVQNFMKCEFWNPKYFALGYNRINFTLSLETMLTSGETVMNILNKINIIVSNYYIYLKSIDVFIVAQLLSKVEEVDDQVLEICLRIVSYTMYIPRDILRDSQKQFTATDLILFHIKRIAGNYDQSKVLYEDNVALVVDLFLNTKMYGLGLYNCDSKCEVILLYTGDDTDVSRFDRIITMNQNLINQLVDEESWNDTPKLVSIIFYDDALFNAEDVIEASNNIFGIYFPNHNSILSREFALHFSQYDTISSNYSCFNWNYQADENLVIERGSWVYNSRARKQEMLFCNFYSSGYFSVMEYYHTYDNITESLTTLLTKNVSFSEKLYRIEDTLFSYWDYLPVDIHLLSKIFSQCDNLDNDELERINIIVNNILRIPKYVLEESEENFDALRNVLRNVNEMASFAGPYQYSSIKDHFGLVICELNESTIVGVTVTRSEVTCFTDITDETFASPEHTIAGLALSEPFSDRESQTFSAGQAKVVVMVLLDNLLVFLDEGDQRNTSVIFGISVPSFGEQLHGNIVALFSNHVYNTSKYECAYWDSNKNDSWSISGDKTGTDSFTKCTFRQGSYLALVESSSNNSRVLTKILEGIIKGNYTPSEKLTQTQDVLVLYSNIFEALHVYYVAEILSHVVEVNFDDLHATAVIANNLTTLSRRVLVESQIRFNATDWILYHVDRIAEEFGKVAIVVTENLVVLITDNITGVAIKNCNISCDVVVLHGNDSLETQDNLNTALLLDADLQSQISNSSSVLIVTIYFNDALFNEGYSSQYKNIGQIIGVIVPPMELQMNGLLKFYYYTEVNSSKVCAFWNYTVKHNNITKGYWERERKPSHPSHILVCETKHATHFALLETEKNVTSHLENILNSNSTIRQKLEEVVDITSSVPEQLLPVDIYLISKILDYAVDDVGLDEMILTSHIISRMFHVPRKVLRESQVIYYATDRILHAIDEMAKLMDEMKSEPIVRENFVVAIYDLKSSNVSGLMLETCSNMKCNITALKNSVNLTELSQSDSLETAVVLSDSLLRQIEQSQASPKLVTTIFFSDVLFNEGNERDGSVGMIFGLLLPGLEKSLDGNIYLMYNTPSDDDHNNSCAFWNYNVTGDKEIVKGSWKNDATPRRKEHFTMCEFNHTTHFALLLSNTNSTFADANKYHVLDIMTIVNCVLSLIGILGILLTATLFERWRRNTGNQILVNFVIAISIKIVMLYVSVAVYSAEIEKAIGCSVTGAILHYAILSEFCWMLIIAILQFKRFVEVLGGPPKYILLKACICGWVFPLLPVTLILIVDSENYCEGQVGLCYPSGLGLYLGIWLPIVIIVAINFVIFIFIIYNVFHKKTETRDLVNNEILFQWRLALLLFSMLGLTWLFGFLGQINGAMVFVYLFCFTSTLQGFIMFMFFIVFNQSTRFLYAQSIKLWLFTKGYKVP